MATYNLISSLTVPNSTTGIMTFSSIPQTYTDLLFRVTERSSSSAGGDPYLAFNGVQTNFSSKRLVGNGTSINSYSNTGGFVGDGESGSTMTALAFASLDIYIPNYTSSNYKTYSVDIVTESNSATNVYMNLHAGLWSNTAAITSVGLTIGTGGTGYFDTGCTFYLYGIKNS